MNFEIFEDLFALTYIQKLFIFMNHIGDILNFLAKRGSETKRDLRSPSDSVGANSPVKYY